MKNLGLDELTAFVGASLAIVLEQKEGQPPNRIALGEPGQLEVRLSDGRTLRAVLTLDDGVSSKKGSR